MCSSHQVPSPCECGEPLNQISRDLFEEPAFDPLGINPRSKIKALSIFVSCFVLILVLSESVSIDGIRFDPTLG